MSYFDCIKEGEKEGVIKPEQAAEMRKAYQEAYEENLKTMSPGDAASQASRDAYDSKAFEVLQRKVRLVKQYETQNAALNQILSEDGKYVGEGVSHILDRDGSGRFKFRDLDSIRQFYLARSHSILADVIEGLRRSPILGRETRESEILGIEMTKEVFGQNSGNPLAKQFADSWKEASEMLRQAFNRAGGAIPLRKDWGLPQQHNRQIIRQNQEQWLKDINDLLDWGKIKSERTGKLIPKNERQDFLEEIRETILSAGMSKVRETSIAGKGRSLARRRADHRFLVFKNPDSWLAYQKKYGEGDPFTIMMNHIEGMSRDIATLERLGPNPNTTISFLKTQLQKRATDADIKDPKAKNVERLNNEIDRLDEIFNDFNGNAYIPANETWAKGFASLGELLISAQLGSAAISAVFGDASTARMVARIAGLPHAGVMAKSLKTFLASNPTKKELIRAGLIAENWSSIAYGQSRYVGDLVGSRVTQRVSNFVMNVSGLSPITQAERWSFGQSVMGFLADKSNLSFKQLDPKTKRWFKEYGINKNDWDFIRKTSKYNWKGADWLRPVDVFETNELAGQKYFDLIQSSIDKAVPVSGPRARSVLASKSKPGTLVGDVLRSIAQYKTFPIVLYLNNIRQIRHLDTGKWNRIGYATEFLAYTTLMGALSLQIREVLKGKDPAAMFGEDGKPNGVFWTRALIHGGALSIFGDFLLADHNRYGHSLGEAIMGPRAGFLTDVGKLTIGNVQEFLKGKETNIGRESIEFLARYGPGTSISYVRAPIERLVLDNLRKMADPEADRRFRRKMRELERTTGSKMWWAPGDMAPKRAPDLSSIVKDLPR